MKYRFYRNCENLNKMMFEGIGAYDTPCLKPVTIKADSFVGFNDAKGCKTPNKSGVHFFIDDYRFNCLWNRTDAYLELLSQFHCVCSPDFSTYTDYPKAIQIYNHYRKHWLGAYWQMHGITVIPTISWSDEESYSWCFDGEPRESIIAVSSVGTQKNRNASARFIDGFRVMLSRLQPYKILFYGRVPDECYDERIVPMKSYLQEMEERLRMKK